jgi:hypothetical protein
LPCPDPHDNLDVPAQRIQEAQKSVGRKAFQLSTHKIGHVGLVNAQERSRACLRQTSLGNSRYDLSRELRFGESLAAVRHAQILEYIA